MKDRNTPEHPALPRTDRQISLQRPEADTLKLERPDHLIEISHDPGILGSGVSWHNAVTQCRRTGVVEAHGSSEFLNIQIPLAGSFRMETVDGVEVCNANIGLTRSREDMAFYDTKGGETHHLFNIRADIDVIANWFGDGLPAPLRPFLKESLTESLHCPAALPWSLQEALKLALSSDMPLRRLATEAASLQIMTHMLGDLCNGATTERGLSPLELKAAHEAYALLANNLAAPCLAAELARHVGLSTRRLELAFREVFGMSVFEASRKIRFDAACQVLREGMPIKAVALNLGYANASGFTYAFRRYVGLPPAQWLARKK